jgi:DNA-binding protein H-NS
MNLKSMSLDRLAGLRDEVNAALSAKVIDRFQGGAGRGHGGARGAVAPKYRNPENPAETWAGRGLKPRWLTAAIKAGKKPDDFLIAGVRSSPKANGRKKARNAGK